MSLRPEQSREYYLLRLMLPTRYSGAATEDQAKQHSSPDKPSHANNKGLSPGPDYNEEDALAWLRGLSNPQSEDNSLQDEPEWMISCARDLEANVES
jgi:hypothetical protein